MVLTQPDNGARLFRAHDNQSVAFIPKPAQPAVATGAP